MCLIWLSSKKNRDKFLKETSKRGYIRVYKVCKPHQTGWCYSTKNSYRAGLVRVKGSQYKDIDRGFHAYLSLSKARGMLYHNNERRPANKRSVVVCYAKPAWLKGLSLRIKEASFTHLVFPEWEKGNMTIKEFRQVCKGAAL